MSWGRSPALGYILKNRHWETGMSHTATWNFLSLGRIRLISCLAYHLPIYYLILLLTDVGIEPKGWSPAVIQPRIPCKGSSLYKNASQGYISHGKVGLAWESAFSKSLRLEEVYCREQILQYGLSGVEVLGFPQDLCTHTSCGRKRVESSQCPKPPGVWCHLT